MFIDIYPFDTANEGRIYRGINRLYSPPYQKMPFLSLFQKKPIDDLYMQYLALSVENTIPYTAENRTFLTELYKASADAGFVGEIIVYGEIGEKWNEGEFSGYDVCGDCYESAAPMFTSDKFYRKCILKKILCAYFNDAVNGNGLFKDLEKAKEFAEYMNYMQDTNFYEKDANARPVQVWSLMHT